MGIRAGRARNADPGESVECEIMEKRMKTLTCRELGGDCDQKLTAETWDEMVKTMTAHVMEKHPDVAQAMKEMHETDPRQWGREMQPKWEAAPSA